MKKLFVFLTTALLLMVMCIGVQATERGEDDSFSALHFMAQEGFCTVITDIYGDSFRFDGVLNIRTLESHACAAEMAGYAVYSGEDCVFSVQLHDILPSDTGKPSSGGVGGKKTTNGYYSVAFSINGGTHDVFLTGLTPDNLQLVQDAAVDAILTQNALTMEDIAFIDTEKQYDVYDENDEWVDSDRDLCWAASTSNILYYTGWAQKAGFASTDYMYEELIAQFSDHGGRCYYGLQWFFNGMNRRQGSSDWAADEDGYESFHGYLPQYCVSTVAREINFDEWDAQMNDALLGLQSGCGVELNFGWYPDFEPIRNGGHSITLWGMVTDHEKYAADVRDKEAYYALIVSDSDSDVTLGENRRTAPNMLSVRRLLPATLADYDTWYMPSQSKRSTALLEGVVLLQPYSDSIPADGGTQNSKTAFDLTAEGSLTCSEDSDNSTAYFASGERISVSVRVTNNGSIAFSGTLSYRVRVYNDATGELLCDSDNDTVKPSMATKGKLTSNKYIGTYYSLPNDLPAGNRYRAEIALEELPGEAYYGNNAATLYFYVGARSQSQDDMRVSSASVRFASSGNKYEGTLSLDYEGELGFAVQKYIVEAAYEDDSVKSSYEMLYTGKELPTELGGVKPSRDVLCLWVYAIPEDPLGGYERILCEEMEVPLSYLYIYPSAGKLQTFSPIREGDTKLADGDKITVSVYKEANRTDNNYLVEISAYDPVRKTWTDLIDEYCSVDDFLAGKQVKYLSFSEFDEGKTLSPGEYWLYVYTYYDAGTDGYYQCSSYDYIGDLTVLGTVETEEEYSLTAGFGLNDDLFCSRLWYEFSAPEGADLTLRIDYGTDESMKESFEEAFEDYAGGYYYSPVGIPTEPGQTYYYQVSLLVEGKAPLYAFTEPQTFASFALPEQLTVEKKISLKLQDHDTAYYRFTAMAGKTYTISIDNGDMGLRLWNREADCWETASALPYGREMEFYAADDGDVFFSVDSGRAGKSSLLIAESGETLATRSDVQPMPAAAVLSLDYGETVYFDSLAAFADTEITVTASGSDGVLEYWDAETGKWIADKYFTNSGKTMTLSVDEGKHRLFRVKAFIKGDYTLCCSAGADLCELTETGANVFLRAEQTGHCIIAAYDENGRMLDTEMKTVAAGSVAFLQLTGTDIRTLRCFRLTSDFQPQSFWEKELCLPL